MYTYLKKYAGENLFVKDLNTSFCEGFKSYLLNAVSLKSDKYFLSNNTSSSYFNKFRSSLKQAYKEGILNKDINSSLTSIKLNETKREFLSIEELNQLAATDFEYDVVKRASIFSCLTGLRYVDIKNLTWDCLSHSKEIGYRLRYRTQKTKSFETLIISDQAYELLLPDNNISNTKSVVFKGLKYSRCQNDKFKNWIKRAGINKNITFHCFRHTFATLQLAENTNIYVISKILGHKNVSTTQIYTKVMDKSKIDAKDKIKLDYNFLNNSKK